MGILDWFRGEQDVTGRTGDARTDEALERIVELTNPRLRFARRYRARLKPAVRTAMEYAKSVVARAAPAREASAAAWQSDATIRALFATAEDLARAFSRSPDLREWCDRNTSAQDVYAVLSMLLVEQNAALALNLADHAYVLETGNVVMSGPASVVKDDEGIRRSYLGY